MATAIMSVIIVVYNDSANLRLVLERLRTQTAAPVLECVLVTTCRETAASLSSALQGLAAVQIASMNTMESAGFAKAAGLSAATAPLAAFLEDHSLPEKAWTESLIKAHERGEFAVVGSVIQNANPVTAASWGCFLVYYGQYMFARPQCELKHLPANHSCYRRSLLLEYGPRLPDLLEAESVLHQDLLARGFKLFQEPAARTYHINHSRLHPTIEEYFLASRVFAAERASKWKPARKIFYALGSPLLPLVRSLRMIKDVSRAGLNSRILAKAVPAVLLTLCSGAAGEMIGYILGAGKAKTGLKRFESGRYRIISERDLEAARMV